MVMSMMSHGGSKSDSDPSPTSVARRENSVSVKSSMVEMSSSSPSSLKHQTDSPLKSAVSPLTRKHLASTPAISSSKYSMSASLSPAISSSRALGSVNHVTNGRPSRPLVPP